MSIYNWSDRYYQQLFSEFNISSEDFITKASATDLNTLLDQLVDYGIYQMYAEELWMRNNQFPGLTKHSAVHERICRKVLAIQKEVHDRSRPLSLEILSDLHTLLKCHILVSDGIITDFIVHREEDIVRQQTTTAIAGVVFHETANAEVFAHELEL